MIHSLLLNASLVAFSVQTELPNELKTNTINTFVKELHATYVQPQVAKKIEASLRAWSQTEEYRSTTSGAKFADRINELMKREVTDGHLWIRFSKEALAPREKPREPSKAEIEKERKQIVLSNAGFKKVERLQGNIGYLKVDIFYGLKDSRRPMESAMNFLANTDAIIVDLRDHMGGESETCDHFASYFFPAGNPTKLGTLYDRKLNKTLDIFSTKNTFGPRYTKPVYVLTSKRTGSAAEAVAYNIKTFKRGVLVGQSTYGIANMGDFVRINDHFMSFIPYAQGRNAVTGTNWEATGVLPDIEVNESEALKRAHIEALETLLKTTKEEDERRVYKAILNRMNG